MVKYYLEDIVHSHHKSFHFQIFDIDTPNRNSPHWHYHPEIEFIYISNGKGKRGVGTSLSTYSDGDLILLGSNLQHMGFTDNFKDGRTEVVIQFLPDFLGNMFSFSTIPSALNLKISIEAPGGIILVLANCNNLATFIFSILSGSSNIKGLPTGPATATVKPISFI